VLAVLGGGTEGSVGAAVPVALLVLLELEDAVGVELLAEADGDAVLDASAHV
jgi:hypothetical protein